MSRRATAAVLGLWAAAGLRVAGQKEEPAAKHSTAPVGIQMRNVNLRMSEGVMLQIRDVRGRLTPTSSERPVTLDLRDSFFLDVDSGTMAIDTRSLAQLLNTYVFAYEGAPLKNLSLSTKGTRVVQKGTMHKGVDLPFELEGTVSAAPDGSIKLHVDKLKTEHVPFKGLLHFFGEDLSKLINLNQARGVKLEGDDILMFPDRMMPAPHIHGRVVEVHVEGGNIVQVFRGDHQSAPLLLPAPAANYIYHRGGILRFGKLTMTDADLEIIDANPKTPFDFSLMEYNRQLVAGYSKNTASHGLIVHMPDYGQIASAAAR